MKIISWNCRGIGNPRTVSVLRDLCWRELPYIVFVMETKIDSSRLEGIRNKCGFTDGISVCSNGLSGGIGLWWRDVSARLVSFSSNHIAVDIVNCNNGPIWRAVGVYGWPEKENKHKTWALMKNLRQHCSIPMVFFGDFNEVLIDTEKEGGIPRSERCMDNFREVLNVMGVRDLGFKGCKFTWQRGQSLSALIRERLDRFLACDCWCGLFPYYNVNNLPINVKHSDHAPIILKAGLREENRRKKRIFRFEALWLSKSECESVVKSAWNNNVADPIHMRIANCAESLSLWASNTFGDIRKRIKKAEERLLATQQGVMDGVNLHRCWSISQELDELLMLEESYWQARARANELRDGDKNTSYFHHKANARRRKNSIKGLEDGDGVWKQDKKDMQDIILGYFSTLFTSDGSRDIDEALAGVSNVITDEMNQKLCAEPTGEEIHRALFEMHPNKAPGIDGMHALFYQKFWHVVGIDIINFILDWWYCNVDISDIGKTCIVLIPKCQEPRKITEYRPISLCNVLYKIISKMMANRLKPFLKSAISQQQSAFVPGRLITDNALVAFEIFHYMKRKGDGKHGTMALKLDMMKAYDRVEWGFLEHVMLKFGFCASWMFFLDS
ncbi:uncharacterized protein LOC110726522 [Chenopodium quinoa]|uniref:uncharacterized protein LOC110726522 n=1 Tax=Chenopodium quinoa TaxID=63459 RepID=UPI000B775605|nr:uncharacterized protein LOC110726522 [Chenopodium quinoa]